MGKKKIEIKHIVDKNARMVTFCKRRKGLFKKAQEFHKLTGADIAVLVFSPAGNPYVYGSPSFPATIDHFLRTTQGQAPADHLSCTTPANAPADHLLLTATPSNAPLLRATPSNSPADQLLRATQYHQQRPSGNIICENGGIQMWRQVMNLIDDQVGSCEYLEKLTAMKSNLERLKETVSFFASFAD